MLSRDFIRKKLFESLKENFFNFKVVLALICCVGLISSCFVLLFEKYEYRHKLIAKQEALAKKEKLRLEWSQLLIEHASLTSPTRIERIAQYELKMHQPKQKRIILLNPIQK
jgi:cell division protein FtsL